MVRKYNQEEIERVREASRAAPPIDRGGGSTTRQVVRELADVVSNLVTERGYTYAQVAELWSANGIKIGASTMAQYARDEGVGRVRTSPSKRARKRRARSPSTGAAAAGSGGDGASVPPSGISQSPATEADPIAPFAASDGAPLLSTHRR